MSNLIHNERIKLQATAINNVAVGILLGGFAFPLAAGIRTDQIDSHRAVLSVLFGSVVSLALWRLASRKLGDLRE